MTNATAQKSTKGADVRPPREILNDTKARRAWLAAALDRVLAESDTDRTKTKIVGTGSYQVVSVWKLVTVEGRERFRGVCQFCGHAQVVDGDRIALHGYNRPGIGYIIGQCPGAKEQPLNTSDVLTRKFLDQFRDELPTAIEAEATADAARIVALSVATSSSEIEWESDRARPRMGHNPTDAQREAFAAAEIAWARTYPKHAALLAASKQWTAARNRRVWLVDMVRHLEALIAAGILGSPLTREVVA